MKRPRTSATGFTRTSHTPWSSLDSNTAANVAPPPRGTGGVEATQRSSIRQGQRHAEPAPDSVLLCRSTTTMPESAAALVLFRLGDRGDASPRDRLLAVVAAEKPATRRGVATVAQPEQHQRSSGL